MVSGEEKASWKVNFADSEESTLTPVADFHTAQTSSAALIYPADRDALALPLMPATNVWVNENGKIVLTFMTDAADTVESEESDGVIPIILKSLTTGAITHLQLRVGDLGRADFAGFDSTNDIVGNTTNFIRLGAYTVPAGFMATLDAGKPVHLYLGDDTA